MASLNDVDSTGVCQHVIGRVKEWRDWLLLEDHEDDKRRRDEFCSCLSTMTAGLSVNQRDAEYIVECLRVVGAMGNSSNPYSKTTVLRFVGNPSDAAIDVVCRFLRDPNNNSANKNFLPLALTFADGTEQYRRVLEALHGTNRSVKELDILNLHDFDAALLQHKTDFVALRFRHCGFCMTDMCAGLAHRRHEHLQTLQFCNCFIGGDAGLHALLEALRDGDFPALKEVDLQYTKNITPLSLRSLIQLGPVALRHITKLNLNGNPRLLDDLKSTREFIRTMSTLKELGLCDYGDHLPAIIQMYEDDQCKLQVLDMGHPATRRWQGIREQLMESIPKMKKLEHLKGDAGLLFPTWNPQQQQQPSIMTLQQNTSIVKLTLYPSMFMDVETINQFVAPILNRNQILKNADALLALQPKTQRPIQSKSGIWAAAFAKISEKFNDEHAEAHRGDDEEEEEEDDHDDDADDSQATWDGDGDGDGDDDDDSHHSDSYADYVYTGAASAIFKILQRRPVIFQVQLRRPAAAAAAVAPVIVGRQGAADAQLHLLLHQQQRGVGSSSSIGISTNPKHLETDDDTATSGSRKRRRL
jgi:hypothetical protein